MADYKKIVPLFLDKEGGLSKDTNDTASKKPSPCTYQNQKGWHTNKGVTWETFNELAPKLGYKATCENFVNMPQDIWGKIFKEGFWDKWDLDKMNNQAIADTIVWWSWGSGITGATNEFKKYLSKKGVEVSTRADIVRELDKLADNDEKKIFDELTNHRLNFYASAKTANQHLKGWTNAYKKFTDYADSYIGKYQKYGAEAIAKSFMIDPIKFIKRNWIAVSIVSIAVIGLGLVTYKLIKK